MVILVDNPHDLQKIDGIRLNYPGRGLQFCVALKSDIMEYIKLFTQDEKEVASMDDILSQLEVEDQEIEEAESAMGEEDSAVVQLVNKIILDAHARNASDIHIEPMPGKKNTVVRVRVDGSCAVYQTIPFGYRNALVSRIKIMSDLDIAERRKPQDGKIKFKKYSGKDIDLRVATVPTAGGLEDVVMRILAAGEPIPLHKLGMSEQNFENFVSVITQPYGIIFVCGPTGSGKTTSLHSALGYINKPETKIWTAEDPVEITQKGLRQVQVIPKIGFDFESAMRAFLRADPDVIMVGEMRDKETTSIGIEASLTGHLVFSTLHTNSAKALPDCWTWAWIRLTSPMQFCASWPSVLPEPSAASARKNFIPQRRSTINCSGNMKTTSGSKSMSKRHITKTSGCTVRKVARYATTPAIAAEWVSMSF